MNFEEVLRMWMAGHGMSPQECDTVCADSGVAFSLRLKDEGGMLSDLSSALWRVRSDGGLAARRALDDAGEKLLLMRALREAKQPDAAAGAPAVRARKPKAPPVARQMRIDINAPQGQTESWTAVAGRRAVPMQPQDLSALAAAGTVERVQAYFPAVAQPVFMLVRSEADTSAISAWLGEKGLAYQDLIEADTCQALSAPRLSVHLSVPLDDYLAFFERHGVIS